VKADPEFEQLYRSERQAVFSTVYLLCRDRALAEDATQEGFARALERWGRLRGRSWAGGWVTSTALNVARRALRKRPAIGTPERQDDPDTSIGLWTAVRGLPLRQQQAVVLHYRLDLPVEEVAELMALRQGTIRTHLARARQALRDSLEGERDVGGREHPVRP
jgi:RNA polymerase sigma-70 factor (ECF subfamily)